jgi:hypothetical protein
VPVGPCKAKILSSSAEDKLFIPNWMTVNNLGAFAKLLTANIDFVMSVCLSFYLSACNSWPSSRLIFINFVISLLKRVA